MINKLKPIQVDKTSFKSIIEGGFLYVDKTDLIHDLITSGATNYFLSRPRRFGKSLLLDTIAEVFKGNRDLFNGLKIGETDYDFETHPVLKFTLSIASDSPKELKSRLGVQLDLMADRMDVKLKHHYYDTSVTELIENIYKKYKKTVVVLFDEYDDPVSSKIDNMNLAKKNAEVLRIFYSGFKSSNDMLRFVLVTGVTRYAMMGISAGFNLLTDISLDERYAAICGFTLNELDEYFSDYYPSVLETIVNSKQYKRSRLYEQRWSKNVKNLSVSDQIAISAIKTETDLRDEILRWYDGYTWDEETKILNPVSVLRFFFKQKFSRYWMATANSKNFLQNILRATPLNFTKDMLSNVPLTDLETVSVGELKPIPLLFQTGYITIDKIKDWITDTTYSFKIPNFEISNDYEKILIEAASNILVDDISREREILKTSIYKRDAAALSDLFEANFSRLTAEQHSRYMVMDNHNLKNYFTEFFYSAVLYLYIRSLIGNNVVQDEQGPYGKPDFTLRFPKNVHTIIEMKYSSRSDKTNIDKTLDNLARKALRVIKEKDYGVQHRKAGGKVISIGMGVAGRGKVKVLFAEE
jgi:hypothetical protein